MQESLAALLGSLGIRAPLAPRSRIEPRTGKPGDLHCEQVVAGGDARAAVVNDFFGATASEQGLKVFFKLLRRLEAAIGRNVLGVEAIERAGNAAGDRVDRLLLAAVAGWGAGIDEQQFFQI